MKAVSGATWPAVLASEESPFIDISIRLKAFTGDYFDDSDSEFYDYLWKGPRSLVCSMKTGGYYSGQRESTRDPRSKQSTIRRGTTSFCVTRGGNKDSRRSTNRSRSRSRLRAEPGYVAPGLEAAAVAGLRQIQRVKPGQEQRQETPVAPDLISGMVADTVPGTNETADQDIMGGGEGTSAEQNDAAE